jgi:RNA polymerase sigma-70 factor (ECF subfamily)
MPIALWQILRQHFFLSLGNDPAIRSTKAHNTKAYKEQYETLSYLVQQKIGRKRRRRFDTTTLLADTCDPDPAAGAGISRFSRPICSASGDYPSRTGVRRPAMQPPQPGLGPRARQHGSGIDWTSALEAHRRWLRTVVRCRVGHEDAIDDVMQEVALAVLTQNARPTDPNKVAPWLYRVAVRQAITYRRRQGRKRRLVEALGQRRRGEEPVADPRDWVLAEESRQTVAAALAELPPQDRQILLLKYTEQWCYRQLADHLGVGLNVVEYRLLRAKNRLRVLLRPLAGEDV